VSLVSRLFPKMVVTLFGCFKPVDAARVQLSEFEMSLGKSVAIIESKLSV
jgi:hypothetical protein